MPYPGYGRLGGLRVAAEIIRQLGPMRRHRGRLARPVHRGELHPSLSGIDPAALQQEQAWAFRRLVETKAADQPLLVVIDDIHRSGDKVLDRSVTMSGTSRGAGDDGARGPARG